MTSFEVKKMSLELINKSKEDFMCGVDNGEKKIVDFFISELTNTMRSDSILIEPSLIFGILTLLRKKIIIKKTKI